MIVSTLSDLDLAWRLAQAVRGERIARSLKAAAYDQRKGGAPGYLIGKAALEHSKTVQIVDELLDLIANRAAGGK